MDLRTELPDSNFQSHIPNVSGQMYSFYPNHSIRSITIYMLGYACDVYKAYYPNGNLYCLRHYQNGVLHGEYRKYYANGQIEMECKYHNGEKHGEETYYFDDGEMNQIVEFENGDAIGGVQFTRRNADIPLHIPSRVQLEQ